MSISAEAALDHKDIKRRMTDAEREAVGPELSESPLGKAFDVFLMVSTSVFLLSCYFMSMKVTTMISKISTFEIMYHRSLWGIILLTAYQILIRRSGDP